MIRSCVVWMRGTNGRGRSGYGTVWIRNVRRKQLVHRVVWESVFGPIPPGKMVLHRCDNPPCYNYSHLFLGGYRENGQDMAAKGRDQHGHKRRCPLGHPYDMRVRRSPGVRILGTGTYRACRSCINERYRRNYARRRSLLKGKP